MNQEEQRALLQPSIERLDIALYRERAQELAHLRGEGPLPYVPDENILGIMHHCRVSYPAFFTREQVKESMTWMLHPDNVERLLQFTMMALLEGDMEFLEGMSKAVTVNGMGHLSLPAPMGGMLTSSFDPRNN